MVNLNKIKKEGIDSQINKRTGNMPNTAQAIPFWIQEYILPKEGADIAEATNDILQSNPILIGTFAPRYQAQHETALITEVARNYKEVLKNTDPEYITAVAEHFIGDDKYKVLKQATETGQGITPAFINYYTTSIMWKDIVTLATADAVKTAAIAQISRTRARELTDKLMTNGRFSMTKATTYDASQVNTLPQEQKNAFHLDAGLAYTKKRDPTHFQ